jgi:hypothetical protein
MTSITQDEYKRHLAGEYVAAIENAPTAGQLLAEKRQPGNSQVEKRKRLQPTPGVMNKTEAAYARELEGRRLRGDIRAWLFEPMSLKLARRTHYRPDFLVVTFEGPHEFHEVKGRWEDDARAKTKIAAEKFWMFRFVAVTRRKGAWEFEEFTSTTGPDGP